MKKLKDKSEVKKQLLSFSFYLLPFTLPLYPA